MKTMKPKTPLMHLSAVVIKILMLVVMSISTVTTLHAQHPGHMVINDHRGKPVKIVKPVDNTVEWSVRYQPFGEVEVLTDTLNLGPHFGYAGQYYDRESGYYYNYYRDYDPSLGRYIQADPRGVNLDFSDPQRFVAWQMGVPIPEYSYLNGLNHNYGYVNQNPLLYTDPSGEVAPAVAVGVAAIGGGILGGIGSVSQGGSFTSGFLTTAGGIAAGGIIALSGGSLGPAVVAQLSAHLAGLGYTAASTVAAASAGGDDCE